MSHAQEPDAGSEVAIRDATTLAQFAEMVTLIPAESGDGAAERILQQILAATTWEQLDAPWESSKAEDLAGRRLLLQYAERRPSDYRTGLGLFLVLHLADPLTGEVVVATTGSISIVGQVTRAYALKSLPLLVEFIVADRPTDAGYRPHHLKIWGSGASQEAGSAAAS